MLCLVVAGSAIAQSKKDREVLENNNRIAWLRALPEPNADYGAMPSDYEEIIKEYFNSTLKDPYSAHYSFIKIPSKAHKGNYSTKTVQYGYEVCVNVNAKNSYGAYTGNKPFWFLIRDGVIIDLREEETGIPKRTIGNAVLARSEELLRKGNLDIITANCANNSDELP